MKKALVLLILIGGLIFSMSAALATDEGQQGSNEGQQNSSTPGSINLPNPIPGVTTVPGLIGRVISAVLAIVGSLALVMFIYGGFTWMLSGGNSSAVERGKNILIWASVGLVVIFVSYALINFVISTVTKA